MSKKLVFMLVLAGLGLCLWWFGKDSTRESFNATATQPATSQPTVANDPTKPIPPTTVSSKVPPTPLAVEPEQSSTAELTAAQAYALELKYPPYAQPYHQSFHPSDERSYTAVTLEQQDGTVWALSLKKYRFYVPEPLQFSVTAPAQWQGQSLTVQLLAPQDDRVLLQTNLQYQQGSLQLSQLPEQDWPEELVLRVSSGAGHSIRAPLEWVRPVATVTAIDPAVVQGEDLQIPIKITTHEPGVYLLQALVTDPQQVIARLVQQVELPQGEQQTALLVHGSVLPATRQALSLTAVQVQRMSPSPAMPPRFGNSALDSAPIGEFAASDVRFLPYQPTAEEQQRLQFLQGGL